MWAYDATMLGFSDMVEHMFETEARSTKATADLLVQEDFDTSTHSVEAVEEELGAPT